MRTRLGLSSSTGCRRSSRGRSTFSPGRASYRDGWFRLGKPSQPGRDMQRLQIPKSVFTIVPRRRDLQVPLHPPVPTCRKSEPRPWPRRTQEPLRCSRPWTFRRSQAHLRVSGRLSPGDRYREPGRFDICSSWRPLRRLRQTLPLERVPWTLRREKTSAAKTTMARSCPRPYPQGGAGHGCLCRIRRLPHQGTSKGRRRPG
jgi:hypothetical protein